MATFNIPRGDTSPVLVIAMKVANSEDADGENASYWDKDGYLADGVQALPITDVLFNMKKVTDASGRAVDEVVIKNGTASFRENTSLGATEFYYSWLSGDTDAVGVYRGEFEVWFGEDVTDLTLRRQKRRTFPCTPGDELVINVNEDVYENN